MILPQTDHAMILIAAASLLTQAENGFVTSHDVTTWRRRWGRPVRSRDQRNSPTPAMTDAS